MSEKAPKKQEAHIFWPLNKIGAFVLSLFGLEKKK